MRTAKHRIDDYAVSIDPIAVYLKLKRQTIRAGKPIYIQTIKDIAITEMIVKYELDIRKRIMALEAWRILYFKLYRTKQKVKENE